MKSRQRPTGRPWELADRRIIVDHDDADFTARVVEVLTGFGEVAITKTGSKAADRRIQQIMQRSAYAAGYSQNWETTIVEDPDYIRGRVQRGV